ncbi:MULTISPECIES: HD domain-containing protein [unclassified Solwaraspora]|uniref:HD domain-containing protein n=1 Tax=unclassified Solwaraspora TaxID=2627926 RepID=UPI00259B88C0|nr:HD domain-containing protein [Solwaraspora sp. WMMA2056]WJK41047.1 HD domain-containing protein [Solwaraspora sp. WMMA2056]
MSGLVARAAELAEERLAAALPRRWRHVQAVAGKAGEVSHVLDPADAEVLVAAAWLHDVGYAPGVADTGLHALDGGRWLRRVGVSDRVAALVAHHSCALFEAEERGLRDELAAEFPQEQSLTADALWYADMTTGPDGHDVAVADRLAEIEQRYGPDHPVTRFWVRARPTLLEAVERITDRLAVS